MGASSVTGTGPGASDKLTTNGLSILANGPAIYYTGWVEVEDILSSPPIATGTVLFPVPLPGAAVDYVVLLTGINTGETYIANMIESGGFAGFVAIGEFGGSVMYMVANSGIRPQVVL